MIAVVKYTKRRIVSERALREIYLKGFEGMLATDWRNQKDHVKEIKVGNDIKMPIGEPKKLLEALQDGTLKHEEIAICVKRILEMILWLE